MRWEVGFSFPNVSPFAYGSILSMVSGQRLQGLADSALFYVIWRKYLQF